MLTLHPVLPMRAAIVAAAATALGILALARIDIPRRRTPAWFKNCGSAKSDVPVDPGELRDPKSPREQIMG